jgi:hypothetical protein
MFGYQTLMQETYLAHENFKDVWEKWRNGKLKKINKAKRIAEPEIVTDARNKFHQKVNVLYGSRIEPLEVKFRRSPKLAFDELIEFLSVDITAFRSGYAKEIFLQWLKNTELSSKEIIQLQEVGLKMCQTDNVRREFRRWCRLMIKLADLDFIKKLEGLLESENKFTRLKSKWMIQLIQKHRLDLIKITKGK